MRRSVRTCLCHAVVWLLLPLSAAFAMDPSFFPPKEREKEGRVLQQTYPGIQDLIRSLCLETAEWKHVIIIHYPAGLSETIDETLAARAGTLFDKGYASVKERSDQFTLQDDSTISTTLNKGRVLPKKANKKDTGTMLDFIETYEVGGSSSRFVSLRFREYAYLFGMHGNWSYSSRSFDLLNDRELTLEDVFPDPAKSLPLLVKRIGQELLKRKPYLTGAPTLTEKEADVTVSRLFLTPQGMQITYSPYEQGSFAEGEFILAIPRQDLIAMGACGTQNM